MNVTVQRWRTAAMWSAFAALAAAGCTASEAASPGCPPGAKCPAPRAPATTVALKIDGQHYSGRPGQLVTFRRPLHVTAGRQVRFGVNIRAVDDARVADVWLTMNSYPSGFDGPTDHPTGKYRLVFHHAGAVTASQQLTGSWTAGTLFNTNSLDVTVRYTVANRAEGWPIAHMNVTR